jgi:polyisoprenoid-binding protein YceI
VLLVPLGVAGCGRASEKKSAVLRASSSAAGASPGPSNAVAEPPPRSVSYAFSSASGESAISFQATGAAGPRSGSFATFSGTITVPNGALQQASVTVDIDLASLRTEDPKLTAELSSSRFLDVARYPHAHFSSTSVESGGALGATNTVKGSLELHGITRSIEIPGTLHVRLNGVDVDAEFPVKRHDFGLRFAGKRDASISDEIIVSLTVVAYPVS